MFVVPELIGYLGNQMSIIAASVAFALRTGQQYHIPAKTGNSFPSYFHHLENKDYKPGVSCIYNEPYFHYKKIDIHCDSNTILRGYFQSEKYWKDYEKEVKGAFGFKWEMIKDTVAIHYRAGDFRKYPTKHPIVTEKYLYRAMQYVIFNRSVESNEHIKFVVFSNEIDEAKIIFDNLISSLYGVSVEYITLNDQKKELQLMMNCEHIIGSNSTFSLWGYWLNENPNKIGVFPKQWFGPDYADKNLKDLYPKGVYIL